MPNSKFDILLIEDNPAHALLVRCQIEEHADFQVETCDRLSTAVELLNTKSFDVILLDLNLPDAVGLEGLIKLRKFIQKIPVVVLTGVDDEQLGIMALQRGAQDYLIKEADNKRLILSIRYAIERMRAQVQQEAVSPVAFRGNVSTQQLKQHEVLTDRELQVLKLLGKGNTNQEIADSLTISLTTVKTHISNILQKLAVTDRTKAIVEAMQRGYI